MKYLTLLGFLLSITQAIPAQAAGTGTPTFSPQGALPTTSTGTDLTALRTTTIPSIGNTVIDVLTALAGAAAVIYLIWAGIQYIMAGGSPDKVKAARARISSAVTGIIVITAAYSIIRLGLSIGGFIDGTLQ